MRKKLVYEMSSMFSKIVLIIYFATGDLNHEMPEEIFTNNIFKLEKAMKNGSKNF